MNNETEKILENEIWPPPPTFRPDIDNPAPKIPPLWVMLVINAGGSLLYCGYRAWHLWHTHQRIDWLGDVALQGLIVFTMTTAANFWILPWVRRNTKT